MARRAPPSWVLGSHAVALESVGRLARSDVREALAITQHLQATTDASSPHTARARELLAG